MSVYSLPTLPPEPPGGPCGLEKLETQWEHMRIRNPQGRGPQPHDGRYPYYWQFHHEDVMRDLKPAFERAPKDLGELVMLIQSLKKVKIPRLRHLFAVPRSAMRVATEDGDELFHEGQTVLPPSSSDGFDGSDPDTNGPAPKELTLRILVNHQQSQVVGGKGGFIGW